MIEKIVRIHSVGKFEDYDATGDVTFRRVTLIYAENAQGKTTLSAILRSLSTGEARWIEERHTIGVQQDPQVLMCLTGARAHFQNGAWDNTFPSVQIFDPVFINNNVYAGEAIEFEQRRSLHGFAIGEQGVSLRKKIEQHTAAIAELNGRIRELREQIQRSDPTLVGDDVEAFIALPAIENVDQAIEQKTRAIETVRQSDAILSRKLLSELPVLEVPLQDIRSLLSRQLEHVSTQAECRVRHHFAACMDDRGEAWVRQGMDYVKDERCPFCGQDISAADLIAAYRAYFSRAYSELKEQIAQTRHRLEELMSEQHLLAIQRVSAENAKSTEFWRHHVPADYPQLDAQEIIRGLQDLRTQLISHLERKAASPLALVTAGDDLRTAMDRYAGLTQQVDHYNAVVRQTNQQLEAKKAAVREADLAAAQCELQRLQATKLRYSDPIATLCTEYSRLQREKTKAEDKKETARTRLQEYTATVLGKYEQRINEHLGRFGADFGIVGTREYFYGGNPSMDYRLEIRGQQVPLSEQPAACFRNTLSSGDKATLAFAFFLARLELDPAIQDKIVVFDDPTSRLDCFRHKTASQAIRRIAACAKQVIVLSHDPYLLRDIWDDLPRSERHALCLTRSATGTRIVEWDICQNTESSYDRNYFILKQFLEQGTPSHNQDALRAVAQCIRPLLEHYLRARCPGVFPRNCWLGDMIRHIKQCQPSDAADCLKPLLDDLTDINEYSAPFHHDQNPDAGTHLVRDGELRAYVRRTLSLL